MHIEEFYENKKIVTFEKSSATLIYDLMDINLTKGANLWLNFITVATIIWLLLFIHSISENGIYLIYASNELNEVI